MRPRVIQAEHITELDKPTDLGNGGMGPAGVQECCVIDEVGKRLMRVVVKQMELSAQVYHYGLKLALTITNPTHH